MFDWFAAGVTSTKTAIEIAKSLVTLREEEAVRSRVFELTQSLMELQHQLMTAQTEQMALVKKVHELETSLHKADARADLEGKYRRHSFDAGGVVYKLKPEFEGEEVEHCLCSNCFEKGDIVTLQPISGATWKGFTCPRCGKAVRSEVIQDTPPIPTRHHY